MNELHQTYCTSEEGHLTCHGKGNKTLETPILQTHCNVTKLVVLQYNDLFIYCKLSNWLVQYNTDVLCAAFCGVCNSHRYFNINGNEMKWLSYLYTLTIKAK